MGKFLLSFGLIITSWFAVGLAIGDEISTGRIISNVFINPGKQQYFKNKTPMHKALFTQRGYIQFLRWELPVPEIEEFTFCLWVKSTNLTYSHSIFSYSKNEEQRLVRSWISPFGRSVHLEIGDIELMAHPTRFEEHRWYHICQSWENSVSRYGLWIDGRKEVEGYAPQLKGHVIPSKGDVVVGQEYTDFDKGFEEGIEGAVLGFNLLLASAFKINKINNNNNNNFFPNINHENRKDSSRLLFAEEVQRTPIIVPVQTLRVNSQEIPIRRIDSTEQISLINEDNNYNNNQKITNNKREGVFESTLKEYLGDQRTLVNDPRRILSVNFSHRIEKRQLLENDDSPFGLQLVDLSYNHCEIGRGSPFVGGKKMLISWTRTPVKVFGGAILKNSKSTCGDF